MRAKQLRSRRGRAGGPTPSRKISEKGKRTATGKRNKPRGAPSEREFDRV